LGTKTSSGLAVIGAIVAEFFVGNGTSYDGLGTLMTGWQALTKTDALIAALLASAFLGLALFGSVQLISVTILRRWTSQV
jgi:NitT/TauT family transport system permease protein